MRPRSSTSGHQHLADVFTKLNLMAQINKTKTLAIIGLGYVGLPLAIEFGKKYPVIGFDVNEVRIDELRSGVDRTLEVDKKELGLVSQLKFTSNPVDLRDAQIFIVTVPTPVDVTNRPDLTHLIKASQTVSGVLKKRRYCYL